MYEKEIEELQKWINDDDRCFYTGFNGEEYVICEHDIEDFCDFLYERDPDLIGFPCMVGTGGICFKREDLYNAKYL
jgi:hypothetical protein